MEFYRLLDATFYDCINTIYQLKNLSWIKMSVFEEYGAFKALLQPANFTLGPDLSLIQQ